MMKKIKVLTFAMLVVVIAGSKVLNGSIVIGADNPIMVEVDSKRVSFIGQQPIIKDGRTLVPVRGVFEVLGYAVEWDQTTNTAILSNDTNIVIITVGSHVFITNGTSHSLDVPAQIINNRTMLPLRAVLESVGCTVSWDSGRNAVIVSTDATDFVYAVHNGSVTITGYKGNAAEVNIPSEINGLPVTSIGPEAFSSLDSLVNVRIPNGVVEIDTWAFAMCRSLTNIIIPNSVTVIKVGAFYGCDSLSDASLQRIFQSDGGGASLQRNFN